MILDLDYGCCGYYDHYHYNCWYRVGSVFTDRRGPGALWYRWVLSHELFQAHSRLEPWCVTSIPSRLLHYVGTTLSYISVIIIIHSIVAIGLSIGYYSNHQINGNNTDDESRLFRYFRRLYCTYTYISCHAIFWYASTFCENIDWNGANAEYAICIWIYINIRICMPSSNILFEIAKRKRKRKQARRRRLSCRQGRNGWKKTTLQWHRKCIKSFCAYINSCSYISNYFYDNIIFGIRQNLKLNMLFMWNKRGRCESGCANVF